MRAGSGGGARETQSTGESAVEVGNAILALRQQGGCGLDSRALGGAALRGVGQDDLQETVARLPGAVSRNAARSPTRPRTRGETPCVGGCAEISAADGEVGLCAAENGKGEVDTRCEAGQVVPSLGLANLLLGQRRRPGRGRRGGSIQRKDCARRRRRRRRGGDAGRGHDVDHCVGDRRGGGS